MNSQKVGKVPPKPFLLPSIMLKINRGENKKTMIKASEYLSLMALS